MNNKYDMNVVGLANKISKYRKQLMGVAALYIIIFHTYACFMMGWGILGAAEAYIKRILFFGVDMFLILSGLGVVFSLEKNSLKKFYCNRFIRVYPPIIIMALIMMKVDSWSFIEFIKKVSGYSFVFEGMYCFFWFFTAIVILYIFSPLIYAYIKRFEGSFLAVVVFFFFSIIAINFVYRCIPIDIWDYYGFLNRIPIFVFGIYLGYICMNNRDNAHLEKDISKMEIWFYIFMMIVGGFLAYVTCFEDKWLFVPVSNCFLPNIMLSISSCALLTIVFDRFAMTNDRNDYLLKVLDKALCFFGMISFELYIVQEWICGKLLQFMPIDGRINSLVFNVVCFTSSVFAAAILYYVSTRIVSLVKKLSLIIFKSR